MVGFIQAFISQRFLNLTSPYLKLIPVVEEPPSKEQGDYIQACKKIYLNPSVLERHQAWPAYGLYGFNPGPSFISLGGKVVLHDQYVPRGL